MINKNIAMPKNKIYIILAIFAVLCLIIIVSSVFLFFQIAKKSKELTTDKEKLIVLEREFGNIESFKKNYADYKPNLERIDQLFIDSQNPVKFIEFLEKGAINAGTKLYMSAPSFSKLNFPYTAYFNLSLAGDFSNVLGFLQTMENGPYLIKIKNLNIGNNQIAGNAKSQPINQIKVDFLIEVFAK